MNVTVPTMVGQTEDPGAAPPVVVPPPMEPALDTAAGGVTATAGELIHARAAPVERKRTGMMLGILGAVVLLAGGGALAWSMMGQEDGLPGDAVAGAGLAGAANPGEPHGDPEPVPGAELPPAEVVAEPAERPKPRSKPRSRPKPRAIPKPKPRTEPKPAPKPEPKVEPKPEPKPAPKPEPKVEPKPESKPKPKPEPKPEPKPIKNTIARIKLVSTPRGCKVSAGVRTLGKTPLKVRVAKGETLWVILNCPEYEDKHVKLLGSGPRTVSVKLKPILRDTPPPLPTRRKEGSGEPGEDIDGAAKPPKKRLTRAERRARRAERQKRLKKDRRKKRKRKKANSADEDDETMDAYGD